MLRRWLLRFRSLFAGFHGAAGAAREPCAASVTTPADDQEIDVDLNGLAPAIEIARRDQDVSGVRLAATTIFDDDGDGDGNSDDEASTDRATPIAPPSSEMLAFDEKHVISPSMRPTRLARLAPLAAATWSKMGNG